MPIPVLQFLPGMRVPRVPAEGPPPDRPTTPRWVDAVMLCVVAGITYGIMRAAVEWRAPVESGAAIDLSAWRLPYYAGLSTLRMALAYLISLAFSLSYAR